MKNKLIALVGFLSLSALNASETQPLKRLKTGYMNWREYWEDKLDKAAALKEQGKFDSARMLYETILADQYTAPRSIKVEAIKRLKDMSNLPDANQTKPAEYLAHASLQQQLENADRDLHDGKYTKAANVYQFLKDNAGPLIAGDAHQRLNAMRQAGQII